MRVVHVVPALFGPDGIVGGAERYAFELARHMAGHVPTALVTFGSDDREERFGDLRVRVLARAWHVRGQRSNPFHPKLFAALRDADVVHCHQQHVLTSSLVALWARATGRRVFVSDLGGGGWDLSAYVSTDRWYHGHLHLSDYSRRVHGHDGDARAHVISGGVDTDRFSPGPAVGGARPALFVGRLLPHKGIVDLVHGLPAAMRLSIVGPPPDAAMDARLRAAAEGKQVAFKHGLDDAALVQEYRQALCIVLPSVYRAAGGVETAVPELLGQTLLEGMACGLPALCTDVASLPEVVSDGVTGFVVPPNDPAALGARLQWFHDHPDEARVMGQAGRRRVLEHFTWSRVVRQCLALYGAPLQAGAAAATMAATLVVLLLVGGFARGAMTIAEQYTLMWRQARTDGPFASSNQYLDPLNDTASQAVLAAVAAARVPRDAHVAFVAARSRVPPGAFWQAYFASSYLLYPRRVWPVAWCDGGPPRCPAVEPSAAVSTAIAETGSRFALLMRSGSELPVAYSSAHEPIPGLALVALDGP